MSAICAAERTQQGKDGISRKPEESAEPAGPSQLRRAIKVAISALDQAGFWRVAIGTLERVKSRKRAGCGQFEDHSGTIRSTTGGGTIEISISALDHPCEGRGAVSRIERCQGG